MFAAPMIQRSGQAQQAGTRQKGRYAGFMQGSKVFSREFRRPTRINIHNLAYSYGFICEVVPQNGTITNRKFRRGLNFQKATPSSYADTTDCKQNRPKSEGPDRPESLRGWPEPWRLSSYLSSRAAEPDIFHLYARAREIAKNN